MRDQFATLVNQRTGYAALDARLEITAQKRRGLLLVVDHPELPLHNTPAELAARRRVRKRDMRFCARTRQGIHGWDGGQTLVATAHQHGINVYQYLIAWLRGDPTHRSLALHIHDAALRQPLGRSWADRPERPDWHPVVVSMWHA